MNSPRIRHLVHPGMSVDARNLSHTNGVKTIMTTTTLPLHNACRDGIERVVSRLAVSMLHWANRRAQRRAVRSRMTHDRMTLLLENERAIRAVRA